MRFSLKWILAAVVYVAVAAAAFSQQSWVYADILWAVSLLAVVFATLMAFLARGKGRVAGAGFLLASVCYLTCLAFGQATGNEVVPTNRLLIAAGYSPNLQTVWPTPVPQFLSVQVSGSPTPPPIQAYPVYAPSNTGTLSFPPAPQPLVAAPTPVAPVAPFAMYVRAANAVGMMLFGGLGIAVGLLALKRVSQPSRGD